MMLRNILFISIPSVILLLILSELSVRLIFTSNPILSINVGAFKEYHPTRGSRLKPGYESGPISINSYGFLGPAFQIEPPPGKVRILTIGDSVTFSPVPDNYPRILEKRLNEFFPGEPVEVIVAAVPGYSSYQALDWHDEFLHKLKADITIIYLGWNDIGQYHPFGLRYKNEGLYQERTIAGSLMQYSYLMRVPYYFRGRIELNRVVDLSPMSPDEREILSSFVPNHYEDNLITLVEKSQDQGSIVYLVTLAGLVSYPPTEEELAIMHFPRNLNKKLKLYQAIFEKYAESLRKASSITEAKLIDLNGIIRRPDQRHIFTDTAHINDEGARRFGQHIADILHPKVAEVLVEKAAEENLPQ